MFFIRADETERKYKKAEAFVERLAHSISAKAVYGELVVRYPMYEPASALLKKIRAERAIQVSSSEDKLGARKTIKGEACR